MEGSILVRPDNRVAFETPEYTCTLQRRWTPNAWGKDIRYYALGRRNLEVQIGKKENYERNCRMTCTVFFGLALPKVR